jgi:hypothetical protein
MSQIIGTTSAELVAAAPFPTILLVGNADEQGTTVELRVLGACLRNGGFL